VRSAAALVCAPRRPDQRRPVYYQDPTAPRSIRCRRETATDGTTGPSGQLDLSSTSAGRCSATTVASDRRSSSTAIRWGCDTLANPEEGFDGDGLFPFYEDEDTDDGAVKLSPGKIQRTASNPNPHSARDPYAVRVPAPFNSTSAASRSFDESESWVQRSPCTTGTRVSKGQHLWKSIARGFPRLPAE